MATSLQSYNNLLATCATLWDKIKRSNAPQILFENMQRTFKIVVEQGATLAANTTLSNVRAAQLNECATFLTTRVGLMRSNVLMLGLACCGLLAVGLYNIEKHETTSLKKWIQRGISITSIGSVGMLMFSAIRTENCALDLASRITTMPPNVTESIQQINRFRDTFLRDILYKTF